VWVHVWATCISVACRKVDHPLDCTRDAGYVEVCVVPRLIYLRACCARNASLIVVGMYTTMQPSGSSLRVCMHTCVCVCIRACVLCTDKDQMVTKLSNIQFGN